MADILVNVISCWFCISCTGWCDRWWMGIRLCSWKPGEKLLGSFKSWKARIGNRSTSLLKYGYFHILTKPWSLKSSSLIESEFVIKSSWIKILLILLIKAIHQVTNSYGKIWRTFISFFIDLCLPIRVSSKQACQLLASNQSITDLQIYVDCAC